MLSEISQAVKDKYHVISPTSVTYSTKQRSEQNRITDMEIKNKLTVTRWKVGGENGENEGEGARKEPMDKDKEGRVEC